MTNNDTSQSKRFLTREVMVGSVGIGANNPIRVQSMTTTSTRDVDATTEQIMRLADMGCELVRLTVQGMKEAESCELIKNALVKNGYSTPIVADIHFYPPAAMRVVESVDKVRINPGNFVDKRAQFKVLEYDEKSYERELEKIELTFAPLVKRCKELKKAIRIGTNHGSLSDRIMNRFGDSPRGMIESAFEFARVARAMDFHDIIFSMKSSNPKVMIEAYRLLVQEMKILGWNYPLHLGVTEAGQGEDGRIKSALGIGTLLLDGIGDTIRVSLTEDPMLEIDPARRLARLASEKRCIHMAAPDISKGKAVASTLPSHPVVACITEEDLVKESFISDIDAYLKEGKIVKGRQTPDAFYMTSQVLSSTAKDILSLCQSAGIVLYIANSNAPDDINSSVFFITPTNCYTTPHEGAAVILCGRYSSLPLEEVVIKASAECGSMLIEGRVDGLMLELSAPLKERIKLSFGIMQAARLRTTKTEFISCPGCGRTLFDLQQVSRKIEQKTSHLPGVKIAIMGCIVNGPGEMADADFGFVGSRPGKIDLYIGKECVERNIDMDSAEERLIGLIKAQGKWIDP